MSGMEPVTQDIGQQWQVVHEEIVISISEAELDRLSDVDRRGNAKRSRGSEVAAAPCRPDNHRITSLIHGRSRPARQASSDNGGAALPHRIARARRDPRRRLCGSQVPAGGLGMLNGERPGGPAGSDHAG